MVVIGMGRYGGRWGQTTFIEGWLQCFNTNTIFQLQSQDQVFRALLALDCNCCFLMLGQPAIKFNLPAIKL